MKNDFRALCAELSGLLDNLHSLICVECPRALDEDSGGDFALDLRIEEALERARAALADEPAAPAPPADGEAAELVAEIRHFLAGYQKIRGLDPEHIYSIHRGDKMEAHITVSRLTRAAELLQRQVLVPVSVSERLPGPEDCDAEGRCWLSTTETDPGWVLDFPERCTNWTHWLPAHALPLPEVENQ